MKVLNFLLLLFWKTGSLRIHRKKWSVQRESNYKGWDGPPCVYDTTVSEVWEKFSVLGVLG